MDPKKASKLITASIVLRNLAIDLRELEFDDDIPESDSDEESDDEDNNDNYDLADVVSRF